MQLLPGIFQINGAPYGRHQNGYMLTEGTSTVLFDSGDMYGDKSFGDIQRNTAVWGKHLTDASHLFITHEHYDHCSHAAGLQASGVKVVASQASADAMAKADERCIGWAHHQKLEGFTADIVVADDEEIEIGEGMKIRCIAAPGHCEGLMVYEYVLHGEICWFIGDLFETENSHMTVRLPWQGAPDFDRAQFVRTMDHLATLPCDHLFPGHGPAALYIGHRVVEQALERAMVEWRTHSAVTI